MTLPEGRPRALFVLVHGGGCQDADCRVGPDQAPFWAPVESILLDAGCVVLRYFRGDVPTGSAHAELVAEAVERVRADPQLAGLPVGLLGHSEGTWIALAAAASLSESGRPPDAILLSGVLAHGLQQALRAQIHAVLEPLEGIRSADGRLRPYLQSFHFPLELFPLEDHDQLGRPLLAEIENTIVQQVAALLAENAYKASLQELPPSVTFVQRIDPTVPLAILQGSVDREAPPEQAEILVQAARRAVFESIHIEYLPDHNHYLAHVPDRLAPKQYGPLSERAGTRLRALVTELLAVTEDRTSQ